MSAARLVVALVLCCASSAAATTAVSPPVSDDAGSDAFKSLQLDLIARIAAAADGDALEEALRGGLDAPALAFSAVPSQAIAVIGGGLSGLVSTLRLLELGRSVVLIDKARFFGGNSAKASSGINGCITERQEQLNITEDSVEVFYQDTLKSSQRDEGSYTSGLARRMANDSKLAVEWVESRAGLELVDVGQMGGHSAARTHRPRGRLSGAAFISGLERAVMRFKDSGLLTIHKDTTLDGLVPVGSGAGGWNLNLRQNGGAGGAFDLRAPAVILATGGYSADKGNNSLLLEADGPHSSKQLLTMATTNGPFATGDGIKIGRTVGATTVDMDNVQVHPTGFADAPSGFKDTGADRPLVLCAEILRGVGAVVLNKAGERFTDELDTRKAVTGLMDATGEGKFVLALPPMSAKKVEAHVEIYSGRGLLTKVSGAAGVAAFIKKRLGGDGEHVAKTFDDTTAGTGWPRRSATVLPTEGDYYVGIVQPVLHYTMGGLKIDPDGRVLGKEAAALPGLFAAGEIIGGVHGVNRLGGSSLLDCVVFGLATAEAAHKDLPTAADASKNHATARRGAKATSGSTSTQNKKNKKNKKEDDEKAWRTRAGVVEAGGPAPISVKIGQHYHDIARFVDLHPGGAIHVKDGEDLTKRFVGAHGKDWALLERDEIGLPTDSKGNPVEVEAAEEHHLANYGGRGGSWREMVGRHSWFLIHSIAAKYPDHPSQQDKDTMRGFIAALGQHYPCKLCRKHLQQQLRYKDLGPVAVDSRAELVVWMCNLHNIVNKDVGRPLFSCKLLDLDLMYLKNCGECEVVSKKKNAPKDLSALVASAQSSDGPWDAEMYIKHPNLLRTVKNPTQLSQVRRTTAALDTLTGLKVITPALREMVEKRLTGPKGKKLVRQIKGVLGKSTKQLKTALDKCLLTKDKAVDKCG